MSESPTEHFEHAEHAQHVAHSRDPYLAKVSITIAILAVLAATVGSLETLETAHALSDKTNAAISQNQATDEWGFFSRQSLKKSLYDLATEAAPAGKSDGYREKSSDYERQSRETQSKAKALEHAVQDENEAAEVHEHRHQVLTIAATLLHIAIAIATIAIVMSDRRWPYITAVILGILGTIGAAIAYL